MSKGKAPSGLTRLAWEFLETHDHVTSGQLASAAGVTRQTAHSHLRRMTQEGLLERLGEGRGARYRRRVDFFGTWAIEGLQEDVVWKDVVLHLPPFANAADNVRGILHYSLTEMVNNAIDHSGGSAVRVSAWSSSELVFEVADDGVGAFAHVRDRMGFPDVYASVEAISKGKQTTDPEHHTGEGIFFTSKAVDRFDLAANGLRWVVDNVRNDQAVGDALEAPGTTVRCSVAADSATHLREVFAGFTDEEDVFSRSRVVLRLFERGEEFVSRSEAKRLAASLDEFREVELDFAGVTMVGRGFGDELFRVWAAGHPDTKLIPINMSETVRREIDRARRKG